MFCKIWRLSCDPVFECVLRCVFHSEREREFLSTFVHSYCAKFLLAGSLLFCFCHLSCYYYQTLGYEDAIRSDLLDMVAE